MVWRRTVPYATVEQFNDSIFASDDHDVDAKTLERASNKVDRMLLNAVYDVDTFGVPVDPDVRAAIMEATCAQASFFDEIGDVSGAHAAGGGSLGPLSLPNRIAAAGGSATRASMSQEAADILKRAGLLSSAIGGVGGQIIDKRPVLPEAQAPALAAIAAHIEDETPHPVYDDGDGPSLTLAFENGLI